MASTSSSTRGVMAVLISLVVACGGTTTESTAPSPRPGCPVSLVSPPVPSVGAVLNVPLVTTRDCIWSAQPEVEWLSVDPPSGQGDAVVAIVVGANPQGRTRAGRLRINDEAFELIQEPSPCRFDVAPRQVSMAHQGGRAGIQVTTLEGCVWQVSNTNPWVRTITDRGESSGTFELGVDGNAGNPRTGAVQVGGLSVTISQPAGPDDRTQCRFSFNSGSANFGSAGGEGSVELHTVPGCAWGAVSTQPWIVVDSRSHAVNSGVVAYTVQPNSSRARREGAIVAGGRRHVVRQAAS
jgi:hypothetical protein